MAPELREIYIQGEFGERPEYNPWKADVYSFGMTILDCAILSIGEKKPKKEKLDLLENLYGKDLRDLLEICLSEEVEKRPDFLNLVQTEEFIKMIGKIEHEVLSKVRKYLVICLKNKKKYRKKSLKDQKGITLV